MEGIDKHDAECHGSTRGFFPDRSCQGPSHVDLIKIWFFLLFSVTNQPYFVIWHVDFRW